MRGDRTEAGRPAPVRAAGADAERIEAAIAAARAGGPAAVDEVLGFLAPPLLRAVRALMGPSHPDLEDVLQDVLIAVVDALPSFRGECTLLHFAIRIATRRTTTARRRSRSILGWLETVWRGGETLGADAPAA